MRMSARSRRRRSLTLWLRPSLALSLACACLAPCFVGKLRLLVTTQEETGGRRARGLLTLSLGSADAGGHWRLRLWPCGAPAFGRPVWASTGWRRSGLWPRCPPRRVKLRLGLLWWGIRPRRRAPPIGQRRAGPARIARPPRRPWSISSGCALGGMASGFGLRLLSPSILTPWFPGLGH